MVKTKAGLAGLSNSVLSVAAYSFNTLCVQFSNYLLHVQSLTDFLTDTQRCTLVKKQILVVFVLAVAVTNLAALLATSPIRRKGDLAGGLFSTQQ